MQSLQTRHGGATELQELELGLNKTILSTNLEPSCGVHHKIGEHYELKLHVAALFIILVTSGAAAYGPLYFRRIIERQRRAISQGLVGSNEDEAKKTLGGFKTTMINIFQWTLWAARHFGTGIIIGTAFIHLLPGAHEYLTNPCLPSFFSEDYTSLPEAISMIAAFVIFVVDFFCKRCVDYLRDRAIQRDGIIEDSFVVTETGEIIDANGPGESAEEQMSSMLENDRLHYRRQELLSILIVESGICFHSLFIGLSLALTTGEEFTALLIAIVFHQIFEGIAIGGRLATVNPDTIKWKDWKLWLCATLYGITTPMGIAIGIAVRRDFDLSTAGSLILVGTFDSMSAGLLLYGGLVGLLSRDFHNGELKNCTMKICAIAIALVAGGCAVMGILGGWA